MTDWFEPSSNLSREAPKKPPPAWAEFRATHRRWAAPFLRIEWLFQWTVYLLSRTSLFLLLEYCGRLSILIAVVFYIVETPQRTKLRHYQAWQVINSAQGKGGSGGRIDALAELNEDHVPLLGVDCTDAFLQGVDLPDANLTRANFGSADMRSAKLTNANLAWAEMNWTNLENADLSNADVAHATLANADLQGANLSGLKNWQTLASMQNANVQGVVNPPQGFLDWAMSHGATVGDATPITQPAQK